MSIHRPFHFPLCPRILEQDASLEMVVLLILPVSTLFSLLVSLPAPMASDLSTVSFLDSLPGQQLGFRWPDPLPIFIIGLKLIGQF